MEKEHAPCKAAEAKCLSNTTAWPSAVNPSQARQALRENTGLQKSLQVALSLGSLLSLVCSHPDVSFPTRHPLAHLELSLHFSRLQSEKCLLHLDTNMTLPFLIPC